MSVTINQLWLPIFRQRPLLMIGLCLLLIGLPLSLFLTSLSQFFLAGSFILEGSWKKKLGRFFSNRMALLLAGVWFMHAIGMAWTTDLQEGLHDLRVKLPLLLLPLILAGSGPLLPEQFRFLLRLFVASVTTATLILTAVLIGWIPVEIHDVRDIFIFKISHIRFALFTCLAIVICYWLPNDAHARGTKSNWIIALLIAGWLSFFLMITASATGLLILLFLLFILITHTLFTRISTRLRIALGVLMVGSMLIVINYITGIYKEVNVIHDYPGKSEAYSAEGTFYLNEPLRHDYENGYRVWCYISDPELQREWNKRSHYPYDSLDARGQLLRSTLIRFLSSKGLRKDAEGVAHLRPEEIKGIENGIANINYLTMSTIQIRLREIVWEFTDYRISGDANGHSITQRLEFWRAASWLIERSPIIGIGTGDMPQGFRTAYTSLGSRLSQKSQLRSHNQYLALCVAFGLLGLIYFLTVVVLPFFLTANSRDTLFLGFWLIVMASMLTEDTLETQPGATFFALFFALFLFSRSNQSTSDVR